MGDNQSRWTRGCENKNQNNPIGVQIITSGQPAWQRGTMGLSGSHL